MSERRIVQSTDDQAVRRPLIKASARARRETEAPLTSPHTSRFRTARAVLVGVAIAAIVIAVAVAVGGGSAPRSSAPWSSWAPPDKGTQGALDIAAHVAPLYRQSAANQLAVITVVNLESANAQATAAAAEASGLTAKPGVGLQIAVKPSESSSSLSLLSGNTIAYNLCGVGGKNCAIPGPSSTARLLLLRRESLELALYTLKYLKNVQYVVTLLPPGHEQVTSELTKSLPTTNATSNTVNMAILFDRQELTPLLNAPVTDSLPETIPPSVAQMASAPEAGLVQEVTGRGLFSQQLQTAQDGSTLIELTPLPPQ
jgi:hypothetical protein